MKKKYFKSVLALSAIGLICTTSCTKLNDFGNINTSPNSPSLPQTSLLLSNVERYLARTTPTVVNTNTTRLYAQYMSETLYTSESRYATNTYDYSGIYNQPLEDLATIIKLNTDAATKSASYVLTGGSNANQLAVARILKAFLYLDMTDKWGDIPYSEALQGIALPNPKFDTQQSIYTDLFKELKAAIAQFDNTTNVGGDFIIGSVAKWKKFANTLRLTMALRLSKVDPATGKTEFNLALTDGVLASNTDNISYAFLAEAANENNIYNNYVTVGRYDYAVSKTVVDMLTPLNDPRLPIYADVTASGTYVGMPYGLTQTAAGAYNHGDITHPGTISLIGSKYRVQTATVPIYTYAAVLFDIAEAYKLGWVTGAPDDVNAAKNYLAGITASMAQQGATMPATYVTQTAVAYSPTTAIQQIITQKWIAGYMGYADEAYNDFRRTGFPALVPGAGAQSDNGQIPRRLNYPTTEATLNGDNYKAVIARQGPDKQSTHVWWDK